MKRIFVLDENIIVCGCKGQNEKGQEDLSSAKLVVDIAYHCHMIAISADLKRKYSRKMDKLKSVSRTVKAVNVLGLLNMVLRDRAKVSEPTRLRSISASYKIPRDDAGLVRLAATVRGILVTTDDRLRKKLEPTDFSNQYGVSILRPENAIALAGAGDA